ncbi:MAG TPA: PIN domain-containing protein [Ilumatobacter sp.]|nr:PIN domain-containing protein [Ilumatobacter sp.]
MASTTESGERRVHVVVLDANVLYGIETTDLLLTMATRRLFRPHWSPQILAEVARNLGERPDLDSAASKRRVDLMNTALLSANEEVPDELVTLMPVNEKDRHVLALAVKIGAQTIVTENLRDFPTELLVPYGVEALSSDSFVGGLVEDDRAAVIAAIDAMAARRLRHPKTRVDIIASLSRYLPTAMALCDGPP